MLSTSILAKKKKDNRIEPPLDAGALILLLQGSVKSEYLPRVVYNARSLYASAAAAPRQADDVIRKVGAKTNQLPWCALVALWPLLPPTRPPARPLH